VQRRGTRGRAMALQERVGPSRVGPGEGLARLQGGDARQHRTCGRGTPGDGARQRGGAAAE
jgi:hypothetical protein